MRVLYILEVLRARAFVVPHQHDSFCGSKHRIRRFHGDSTRTYELIPLQEASGERRAIL